MLIFLHPLWALWTRSRATNGVECKAIRLRRYGYAMPVRATFLFWLRLRVLCRFPLQRDVVLLFDERVELPGLSALAAEFVRKLQSNSGEAIEVYREPMDLSRFGSDTPSDPYKLVLRDFLRGKYADKKIDVAVAVMPLRWTS